MYREFYLLVLHAVVIKINVVMDRWCKQYLGIGNNLCIIVSYLVATLLHEVLLIDNR